MEKTAAELSSLTLEDADESSDRKILIAVDFGTTYSGVAWAQTRRVGVDGERVRWMCADN